MEAKTENQIYGKRYRIFFIEPGIMNYDDMDAGTVLVQKSALDRMRDSFIGKPVVNEDHIDLKPQQAFKKDDSSTPQADGVVSAVGTDPESGWDYADVIIWNKDTQKNIDEKGYSASCAYTPSKEDPTGGMWHNFPYDTEVIDGEYNHMAIVDNPRYERVKIYPNSKRSEKPMSKIFKLLGKKPAQKKNMAPPEPNPEESPEKMEMEGAVIEVNGEMIPVEEAIAAYKQQKQNEVTPLSPDDEIEIDGEPEKIKVSELIAALQASKENVGDPKEIKAEPAVAENSCGTAMKNSKPVEQKPNQNFRVLQNAADKTTPVDNGIMTRTDRLSRGKMRYGSAQKPKEATA